jgi:hypothetical protein
MIARVHQNFLEPHSHERHLNGKEIEGLLGHNFYCPVSDAFFKPTILPTNEIAQKMAVFVGEHPFIPTEVKTKSELVKTLHTQIQIFTPLELTGVRI